MLDINTVLEYFPLLPKGAAKTIVVSLSALVVSTILGLVVGLARATRLPGLYPLTVAYVEILRSLPTLVLLFLVFYAIPAVMGFNLQAFPAAVLALGVSGSAPMAEVVRGGIEAVSAGQWEAAHSLGMRYTTILRYVALPQALRISLPPAISLYVAMIKDSSLILIVGVVELTNTGMQIRGLSRGRGTLLVFTVMAAMYFVICYTIAYAGSRLERRIQV